MSGTVQDFGTAVLIAMFCCACADPSKNSSVANRAGETAATAGDERPKLVLSDPALQGLSVEDLRAVAKEAQEQNLQGFSALQQFNAVNTALCQRFNELRKTCPTMLPIMPSGEETLLKCSLSEAAKETVNPEDQVVITAGLPRTVKGAYIMVADSIYESSPFGGGPAPNCTLTDGINHCRVTFRLAKGTVTSPPQFRHLGSIDIRPYMPAGVTDPARIPLMPPLEEFKFELTVNDMMLVNTRLLEVESGALRGKRYLFNMGDILDKTRSESCRVDEEEVNRLKSSVMDSVVQFQSMQSSAEYTSLQQAALNPQAAVPVGGDEEIRYLAKQIAQSKTEIAQRAPFLDDERNRVLLLSNELKANRKAGCRAYEPVKTIDIRIEGSVIAKEVVPGGRRAVPMKPDENDPNPEHRKIFFRFSNALEFEQPDFVRDQLIKIKAPEGLTVRDLKYIQIRKGGVQYENIGYNESGLISGGVSGSKWRYDVYEVRVFAISRLEIFVNDQKIFDRGGINTKLRTTKLHWVSDDLISNEYYNKLMNDTTCVITN